MFYREHAMCHHVTESSALYKNNGIIIITVVEIF